MEQYLALDVGDKRVGTAVGTSSPRSLSPQATYLRAQGKAESKILELISNKSFKSIVVGLPLTRDGATNEQCNKIERFCKRLHRRAKVTFIFVDEYASSLEAQEKLINLKKVSNPRGGKIGEIDAVSAALILESYFDNPASFIKQWEPIENPATENNG